MPSDLCNNDKCVPQNYVYDVNDDEFVTTNHFHIKSVRVMSAMCYCPMIILLKLCIHVNTVQLCGVLTEDPSPHLAKQGVIKRGEGILS